MSDDQRNAFYDLVSSRLFQTAAWRRSLIAKFPNDHRPARAAARLTVLARSDGREIRPGTWDDLAGVYDRADIFDVINDAGREVGFKTTPANLDEFLAAVVEKAEAYEAVAL